MCTAGSEFHVDGAETENAREVKLLVMPEGLATVMLRNVLRASGSVTLASGALQIGLLLSLLFFGPTSTKPQA